MHTLIYAFLTLALIYSNIGNAAGKCSAAKLAATQRQVALAMKTIRNQSPNPWEKLNSAFDEHRECMAVFEAYEFGEAIRYMIKDRWSQISSVEKYKKDDNNFYSFVISGLRDETANIEDIKSIHTLAIEKCPSGSEILCQDIASNTQIKH